MATQMADNNINNFQPTLDHIEKSDSPRIPEETKVGLPEKQQTSISSEIENYTIHLEGSKYFSRRGLAISDHYICYLKAPTTLVIKDKMTLSCVLEKNHSILDICVFDYFASTIMALICSDGYVFAYKIGTNIFQGKIVVEQVLEHKIAVSLEAANIMWKEANKLGVSIQNELTFIEISIEKKMSNKRGNIYMNPTSYSVTTFPKNIRDFYYSPKYSLVYILLEDNSISIVNTQNNCTIKAFTPYSDPTRKVSHLICYKNLAKPQDVPKGVGQKPELSRNHDFSLRDIIVTITEDLEIKVWDFGDWNAESKIYYCLETCQPLMDLGMKETSSSEKFAFFFNLERNYFCITYENDKHMQNLVLLRINRFYHSYQEDYTISKKKTKFFETCLHTQFEKPAIMDLSMLMLSGTNAYLIVQSHPTLSMIVTKLKEFSVLKTVKEMAHGVVASGEDQKDCFSDVLDGKNDKNNQEYHPHKESEEEQHSQKMNDVNLPPLPEEIGKIEFEEVLEPEGFSISEMLNSVDKRDLLMREKQNSSQIEEENGVKGLSESQLDEYIERRVSHTLDMKINSLDSKINNIDEVISKRFDERLRTFEEKFTSRFNQKKEAIEYEHRLNKMEARFEEKLSIMEQRLEASEKNYTTKIAAQEEQNTQLRQTLDQTVASFTKIFNILAQTIAASQNQITKLENTMSVQNSKPFEVISQICSMLEEQLSIKIQNIERTVREISSNQQTTKIASPVHNQRSQRSQNLEPLSPDQRAEMEKQASVSAEYKQVFRDIFDSLVQLNGPEVLNQNISALLSNENFNQDRAQEITNNNMLRYIQQQDINENELNRHKYRHAGSPHNEGSTMDQFLRKGKPLVGTVIPIMDVLNAPPRSINPIHNNHQNEQIPFRKMNSFPAEFNHIDEDPQISMTTSQVYDQNQSHQIPQFEPYSNTQNLFYSPQLPPQARTHHYLYPDQGPQLLTERRYSMFEKYLDQNVQTWKTEPSRPQEATKSKTLFMPETNRLIFGANTINCVDSENCSDYRSETNLDKPPGLDPGSEVQDQNLLPRYLLQDDYNE